MSLDNHPNYNIYCYKKLYHNIWLLNDQLGIPALQSMLLVSFKKHGASSSKTHNV